MIDVVFAVALVAVLTATVVLARSIAASAILIAFGIGISGAALQFAATLGFAPTLRVLQWWLLATAILILVAAVVQQRRFTWQWSRYSLLLIVVPSVVAALSLLVSRALAPGAPGPLTAVGYLITRGAAEDNAKWLNATGELASGAPVDAWANVGGPLLLLLTLAATLISAASMLLYGGINEVAVSAGSLILSEMLLIVIAPFALAPLVEGRFRRSPDDRPHAIPWPFLLLGVAIVVTSVTLLLNWGHLTLQFTILSMTLWASTFIAWRRTGFALALTTLTVITTGEVWFPINVMALGLILVLVVLSIAMLVKGRNRPAAGALLAISVVVLVFMWDFLQSSIIYSLGLAPGQAQAAGSGAARGVSTVDVPSLPLFSSPGGTEVVSALMGAITVISVMAALLVLREQGQRRYLLRFAPIAVMVAYAMAITFADFWAVGTGPGYGSSKITFAVLIPALAATLPVGGLSLDRQSRGMTPLRWFAVFAVVVLLVLDTFFPRAIVQLRPRLWPTIAADPQPYWWPAEVKPTGTQPLTSNPIGCIYLPPGAEKPSVLPDGQRAYSCTRLLTGIAGQSTPDAAVVQWTLDEWLANESLWDHYQEYFNQMSPEARARLLILLDKDGKVVGLESLQNLMNRFPADPTTTTDQ